MRKKYLLGMTLMASLAFSSCTKEVFVVQDGEGVEEIQEDGQVLTLSLATSGDITTRAGRPLLSAQPGQDIQNITLYFVNGENQIVLKKHIGKDEWANATAYSNGMQLNLSLKASKDEQLPGGAYTVYAIGYSDNSDYGTFTPATPSETWNITDAKTKGGTTYATFTASDFSAVLTNQKDAEEIFAGMAKVTATTIDGNNCLVATNESGSYTKKEVPTIVLNRQVAGVTGYFTNLPAKVGDQIPTKIRLVASNKSNKVHFTSMVSGETDGTTTAAATNVVNGSASSLTADNLPYWNSSKKGYRVYEIELSEFFPQMKSSDGPKTFDQLDLDGDGFVGYKDAQHYVYGKVPSSTSDWDTAYKGNVASENMESSYNEGKTKALSEFWKNPNETTQTLVAGSVFAGEFIIPFLQKTGYNTFELQLLDKDDNILKTWNVQVPDGQKVTNPTLAEGIASDGTPTIENDKSTLIYNIYRNHLYSLGMKTNDIEGGGEPGTTDPDPKPQPDPDPNPEDKPEDLSKGQDLLINVNDNWEIIHNMVID